MILFLDICNHTMASLLKGLPTFKSLPSAIGLPFLSSAEDAQLKFRSGDNGIKRLYGEEVGVARATAVIQADERSFPCMT